MFKKRRQRSKKYTLTSFGSVDEDVRQDSHEEEEEDGVFPGSESEFDEDGFAAAPDPTWDSDYLDILEKKISVGQVAEDGAGEAEGPGLTATSGKGAQLFEQQRRRAAEHARRAAARQQQALPPSQPTEAPAAQAEVPAAQVELPPVQAQPPPPVLEQVPTPAPPPGFGMMNGDAATESPASMVVTPPPAVAPKPTSPQALPMTQLPVLSPAKLPDSPAAQLPDLPASNVVNRTARPFAPGFISHRAATAPVVFRPNVAKKTRPATAPMPAMAPVPFPPSEMKPATFPASPLLLDGPAPISSPEAVPAPPAAVPVQSISAPPTPAVPATPTMPLIPSKPSPVVTAQPAPQNTSMSAGRTGILQEALRSRSRKPMFTRIEEKKNSPNPQLLSMVQSLDERPRGGPEVGFESGLEEDSFNLGAEASNFMRSKVPPPVAPKPRVIPETPHIPQMEGKGAELFARRQSRMDLYVVDNTPQQSPQPGPTFQPRDPSPTPSLPSHWKYSPNIRAPPPIGYNPLLSPSCPPGAQRGTRGSERAGRRGGQQKEGIKALDAMRRQPYQLNSAMFSFGGGATQPTSYYQSPMQHQEEHMVGSSLKSPRQIPVKAARTYEIKRFSTPTPMSAPTTLTPTVIAPRSATTLGEPLCRSDVASPPLAPTSPPPRPALTGALPPLPKITSVPIPNSVPAPAPAPVSSSAYGSLQAAKQFMSAPELSPLRSSGIQVPKPRFVATKLGVQANVWRPGFTHH
ncbi:hypothetical protein JZ751_011199 [Albula glossodonta]|uniref:Synaptopodin 2-like protein n=1 Tax=Albula glossodonta TaxID=121402 RepID=A0A8T2NWH8_9TELE|nr:hypothetical protein JZ751_011199 [Albula glossodonta]